MLAGGDRGAVINSERPESSLLLDMVSYRDEHTMMPPSGKLPADELSTLRKWVLQGASWDPTVHIEVEAEEGHSTARNDRLVGWSYKSLARPEVPEVSNSGWVATPIDAFILERLEETGLTPSAPADRIAWLRRVTYDLTGLPPTPEQVDAFLGDETPEAHDLVVDRLLGTDQYGERWGRHWLDVVRYAETNGYERDNPKPFIWRYRDWVIDAFNRDLPYDRFILEQLAGDELPDKTHESIIASGFNRLMIWDDEPPMGRLQARYDVLDDIVRTTSEGFLGMTLGCARCHDHKGDPISQKDYFSFMAFFHGLSDYRTEGTLVEIITAEERSKYEAALASHEDALSEAAARVVAFEQEYLRRDAERSGAAGIAADLTDLSYRFYRDKWTALPDFEGIRHEDEGRLPGGLFDLSPATREEYFGFRFDGRIVVPREGEYVFRMDADDGARLTIDGQTIVEVKGTGPLGAGRDVENKVHLRAGALPTRLDFFQWVGGAAVDLVWGPATPDMWSYTLSDPGNQWYATDFDSSAWLVGPGGFGSPGTPGERLGTEWTTPEIWLRQEFEWNADNGDGLVLALHHDEDVEIFINGVPALRRNGHIGQYQIFDVSAEARASVTRGRNLIAMRCSQTGGGQYIHARPIHRATTTHGSPADLAFGLRSLSASRSTNHGQDVARMIRERGKEVLGEEEIASYEQLRNQRQHLERNPPEKPRQANAATENGPRPGQLHVHVRGNPATPGEAVEPGFPACLEPPDAIIPEPPQGAKSSGRRLALARWIASPENPLTARVMVNRIWQHHFGRGIVPTSNDFGELGERPTHPELLDWLASEFISSGWSVKAMHRLILSSNVYRQAYREEGQLEADIDPNNDLLWRFRMRRLSAEELRDSVLAVNGNLNHAMGGPSIYSMVPQEALQTASRPGAAWGRSPEDQRNRRSIYVKVKRSLVVPLLSTFDFADTDSPCPVRFATTSPSQALALLNSEFIHVHAEAMAKRLEAEAPGDEFAQISRAIRLTMGRAPSPGEVQDLIQLKGELAAEFGLDGATAMKQVCLFVLNLNEFVFLD